MASEGRMAKRSLPESKRRMPSSSPPTTRPFRGRSAGCSLASEAVETPWVFVCAGDMPRLSPEAIQWLADQRAESETTAVVPVEENGKPELLHAFYRREALEEIRTAVREDAGVRSLLAPLENVATVTASNGPTELARSLTNVNTKATLGALYSG